MPLPPLPIEKRIPIENNISNRPTNSNGIYGHLVDSQTLENDDIYTKPLVSHSVNIKNKLTNTKNNRSTFFVADY